MRILRGKSRLYLLLLTACLALLVIGCQQQLNYPAPVAKSISPTQVDAGQPGFALTVTGSDFTPASFVAWNGSQRSTIFNGTTSLTAQILATDIQNAGQAFVQVYTPSPGGGVSPQLPDKLIFTINATSNPVPQITSLSPTGVFAGTGAFTLSLTGQNFASLGTVTVNGSSRFTTFINSTSIAADMLASDVAQAGTLQIAVVNPQPDGGTSNNFPFAVKNPAPTLGTVTPTSFTAGGAGGTLTANGSSFVPGSVIYVNGAAHTTSFVSATQLTAILSGGDIAAAGIYSVQVVNPAPGGGNSIAATFAVNPTPVAGLPMIVDLAPDGTQASNGVCGVSCTGIPTLATAGPSVSQQGQFVAFASSSTNLVTNQSNGVSNIFVRSTCISTGTSITTSACTPRTVKVSQTPAGTDANGSSSEPSLDTSGDHVAYTSTATNLVNYVAVPAGPRQVYWQSTCATSTGTGCTNGAASAALVSVSADGLSPGNGESYNPVISPDGQYVAFVSLATNLVSNVFADGITPQVYVRNTCSVVPPATGTCTPTTYLVSTGDGTTPANAAGSHPAVSDTGLFVAFTSNATNLGATAANPSGATEVFVRSTCVTTIAATGNTCLPSTRLASTPDGVTPADGASTEAAISSDGRFVAFASTGTTLLIGVGPTQQIYVRDTCAGVTTLVTACTPSTQLISTPDGATPANALSENPSINGTCSTSTGSTNTPCATGQYVAFASFASNLGGNVENGVENIFARDTCNGISTTTATTTLCAPYTFLSSQPGGTSPPPADGSSIAPSISGDGRTVGFLSSADNLVAHDTNAVADVFLAGANLIHTLTVTLQGTGSGSVTDGTGQISCVQTAATSTTPLTESGTCTARYTSGTTVTLTATALSGFSFTAWGGTAPNVTNASCSVLTGSTTTGTCTFSMIADNTATANFK